MIIIRLIRLINAPCTIPKAILQLIEGTQMPCDEVRVLVHGHTTVGHRPVVDVGIGKVICCIVLIV